MLLGQFFVAWTAAPARASVAAERIIISWFRMNSGGMLPQSGLFVK